MLSVKQCRELLGDKNMSDAEIEKFLASLRRTIGKFLDNYFQNEFQNEDGV